MILHLEGGKAYVSGMFSGHICIDTALVVFSVIFRRYLYGLQRLDTQKWRRVWCFYDLFIHSICWSILKFMCIYLRSPLYLSSTCWLRMG